VSNGTDATITPVRPPDDEDQEEADDEEKRRAEHGAPVPERRDPAEDLNAVRESRSACSTP
jgi:hypothetical protein